MNLIRCYLVRRLCVLVLVSEYSVRESDFTVEYTELPDRETDGLHLELAPFGLEMSTNMSLMATIPSI
ncbi:uncharacterized protein L3040_008285 [Drepanopeziza brunnea f. sp. 'multigermtubi']|uniref:uncharacterized protein n=1 Tax=Drepanopeziza brunnea f. sp. 'multigermtubi' TaxID=698441 RepID=UPI0023A3843D|nr:hypothetical protein L3040_008285 [Drepanopeziza brunnea f. sp. 'multigermtubi']